MPILTDQDFNNAKRDISDIGKTMNGTDSETVTSRLGRTYPTIAKAIKSIIDAGGYEPFATETLLLASVPTVAKKASIALDTFNVFLWENSSWVNKGNVLSKTNSLNINKNKNYPFRQMVRNGITSTSSQVWNNFILDVRVNNADPLKLYQIAYQQNGATVLGVTGYNWIIYEFDKDTFSTSAVATSVVALTDANQQQLVSDGLIQTVTINSLVRERLSFVITCDTSALPVNKTPINSIEQANPAWSFIIDPSCYFFTDSSLLTTLKAPRPWLYNKGAYYPFIQGNYKGLTSIPNQLFLDLFKDMTVENAEDGFRYSLAYYTNGSTAINAAYVERWIVFKRPESNYSESTATETQIVALNIPQPTLLKTGNIETITLESSGVERFHITVDTSKLPTYGTFVAASQSNQAGYSFYVNKSNYVINSVRNSDKYFEWDATLKSLKYRYTTQGISYEWTFGTNGANNLPNFKEIKRVAGTNLVSNSFSTVQAFDTDWLPPLVFAVVNNPDADGTTTAFTGGNHASNGDATGDPTAENELFSIFVDGQPLDMTKNVKTFCENIDVKVVNRLMASNTRTSKRYALRQIFDLNFNGANVDVHCKLKALEDINLRSDYALQMTTTGFRTTQLILESQTVSRVTFDGSATSGIRTEYPKAFATILKGTGGILASWMDRNYGNGTPENCAPNQPLVRGGGGTNPKFYNVAFRSFGSETAEFPMLRLTPSVEYKWRGGYVLQSDNATGVFDCVIDFDKKLSIIDGNNYF